MSDDRRKTSISHPLQIDELSLPDPQGVVGMTLCPGRKGTSLEGGSWDRDLALDLEAVRKWKPAVVLSLLEELEFATLGIPAFREMTNGESFRWEILPIPDGGVPGPEFVRSWIDAGPIARNALRRGDRVLIHCRAGLGRTGMLAGALLVQLGAAPGDAIARVRAARPNTIETRAQERYVEDQLPIRSSLSRRSRVSGTMLGAAIGDALGSAFEFMSASEIEAALGEPFAWNFMSPLPGSILRPRDPGWPTDDTAMALSVAGVLCDVPNPTAADFARAFLNDLDRETGRLGKLFWEGAPGISTMGALRRLAAGAAPETCGGPEDGGNGAAMRAHPIGTLDDRNEVLRLAAVQAIITHGEPAAVAAACAVAVLVHDAMAGFEPELTPPNGITVPKFLEAWERAHTGLVGEPQRLPPHLLDAKMSGWETVATAHAISYVFQNDPNRALAAAAASGEDTDTVASIVGALVGARCGHLAFDSEWVAGLRNRNDVEDAFDGLMF